MKWVQGLICMQSIRKFTMLDIPIPYNEMTRVQNTKIQSFYGYNPSELQKIWKWYIPHHSLCDVLQCEGNEETHGIS